MTGSHEAEGSIPFSSTIFFKHWRAFGPFSVLTPVE